MSMFYNWSLENHVTVSISAVRPLMVEAGFAGCWRQELLDGGGRNCWMPEAGFSGCWRQGILDAGGRNCWMLVQELQDGWSKDC